MNTNGLYKHRTAFRQVILISILLIVTNALQGANPLKKGYGMADPHCYIFNDRAYLFSTRDADSTSKVFDMPDWQIWSSDDLVDWKLERIIYPTETYMGESNKCWATETITKDGKYYFYFSNGNIDTGVMVADKPEGPYKDLLGAPLLAPDLTSTKEYDPTVLVDDDGRAYILFGHFRNDSKELNWHIARLSEDMVSLDEAPKVIHLEDVIDVMRANDKPNLHKYKGLYYLSAGSHYAVSDDIYGPYQVFGNSGNRKYGLHSRAHGNYFSWNNQWFHTWCHFHLGKDVARYRESYMTYLHYSDDGRMITDVDYMDAHFETGVGQYDANWDVIQAEWYMQMQGAEKRECPLGGFEIQNIQNNATLIYPNVCQLADKKVLRFHVSSANGGTIEVRDSNAEGKILGRVTIKSTGGYGKYAYFNCNLSNIEKVEDVCLRFIGNCNDVMHLDYFVFEQ